jgi:cob(I)alamin adenosyltransferase
MQLLQGAASSTGAAFKAIPTIVKTKSEKENKKEMVRLKALLNTEGAGLTESEKQRILEQQGSSAENAIQRAAAQAGQLQASANAGGSGTALKQAAALGAAGAKVRTDINQAVEAADAAKAEQQRQEYWARLSADSESKQRRLAAWTSIGSSGAETLSGASSVNNTVAPPVKADISSAQAEYNLSAEDYAALEASLKDNPEYASQLSDLLK